MKACGREVMSGTVTKPRNPWADREGSAAYVGRHGGTAGCRSRRGGRDRAVVGDAFVARAARLVGMELALTPVHGPLAVHRPVACREPPHVGAVVLEMRRVRDRIGALRVRGAARV